ncbi:methylated-DNA--[protein]-cysteine S-methyltransferase [Echinicola jeungdonensis]|uniref:Bifunctional helix-turn-helix domain-containing protein/methylated-DNA--[protein]-cysteine S-methyltransferase n=1 Tax=Echinicola jeungdonensis TaxID=709343 RepID=A0ABV5J2N2_9BACT|nr:methylated-DNA--[protein]-cysteine S-methyltransferase [Echinicola jeungdonensis]MDN3671047.1 methylated-DNA--[protein]-cysteine S-methyltransferase [Echinicola jeungdonensis]
MKSQEDITYQKVAEALAYLQRNFQKQPKLEEVAKIANLSPYHFQRVFSEWAGVSPKKFLQYISLSHAKKILKESRKNLLETSYDLGLSGPGRLHDLFIKIEGMTPGEYKDGGKSLVIHYSISNCPFGKLFIASTSKGICQIDFLDKNQQARTKITAQFPKAKTKKQMDEHQQKAIQFFARDSLPHSPINLHLKGSNFQLKVWEALLKIPLGQLSTYGQLAKTIQNPNAARAVGSAISRNPVAYLIPCHRVIQSSGIIGGYKWGSDRKMAMLGWESAKEYGE